MVRRKRNFAEQLASLKPCLAACVIDGESTCETGLCLARLAAFFLWIGRDTRDAGLVAFSYHMVAHTILTSGKPLSYRFRDWLRSAAFDAESTLRTDARFVEYINSLSAPVWTLG